MIAKDKRNILYENNGTFHQSVLGVFSNIIFFISFHIDYSTFDQVQNVKKYLKFRIKGSEKNGKIVVVKNSQLN